MSDLLAGLALAILLEGLLWALAPDLGRRMLQDIARLPERQLQLFAWTMVITGLCLFWLARGI
jgi:hypothetical protein